MSIPTTEILGPQALPEAARGGAGAPRATFDSDPPAGGDAAAADAAGEAQSLSFWDFLDVINPLQHLPLISTAYRALTGDEIKPAARIAGDTLFGGPFGFMSALANAIVEQATGKDIGETVLAFAFPATPTSQSSSPPSPPSPPSPGRLAGSSAPLSKDAQARPAFPPVAPAPAAPEPFVAFQARRDAESLLARRSETAGAEDEHDQGSEATNMPAAHPALHDGDPQSWFTRAMVSGLEKYRALATEDRRAGAAGLDLRT